MDKETNKEIREQLKDLEKTLLGLKLQEGIDPNEIRLLQQKLDRLIASKTFNDDKNKN
tara:strand:- start:835 stop:1008 length:174 start_codon:yes stop_codon:yes gene_type:complete